MSDVNSPSRPQATSLPLTSFLSSPLPLPFPSFPYPSIPLFISSLPLSWLGASEEVSHTPDYLSCRFFLQWEGWGVVMLPVLQQFGDA